ncbi:hypothetical protein [Anaerosporobacter sp.]|uniref:hypothetical protein n=1 Tax=Anaerosporobacter sp. TaxID=1872529 RepID=UPI00286F9BE0|nr:hypothetical protein [Anaerosporobacter sp.]
MRDLRIELSLVDFLTIEECSIYKKVNEHGKVRIRGIIEASEEMDLLHSAESIRYASLYVIDEKGGYSMFKIEYIIIDEGKEELMSIVDNAYVFIEGQIEISFNEKIQGGVLQEATFLNEYIDDWFNLLNQVAVELKEKDYVAFSVPETSGLWIEFKCEKDVLIISKFTSNQGITGAESVVIKEVEKKEFFWKDEVIKKEDFFEEIHKKTSEFINEIFEINPNAMKCKNLERLMELHQRT